MSPYLDSIMKNLATLFIFILILSTHVFGQRDRNISIWNASPTLYNAAAVASGPEDYSFFTNFRTQWLAVSGALPCRTNNLVTEFKIPDGSGNNHFGIGMSAMNDQSGDTRLNSTFISIPINYSIKLDQENLLSIGISPGYYMQYFDNSAQTWENQWDGTIFNTELSSGENLNTSYSAIDLGSGIYYQNIQRNSNRIYGGVSLNHITRQKIDFSFGGDKLYRNLSLQAGADFVTRRRDLRVQPQLVYIRSGRTINLTGGVQIEHIIQEASKITEIVKTTTFNYGFFYRWNDAIVATIGFKLRRYKIGLAFDANISKLSQVSNGIGAVEVYFKTLHLYKYPKKRTRL
jgi:type IX secretion system PorP/SprF family membrane protein